MNTVWYVASGWMGTLERARPLPAPYLPGLNHERRELSNAAYRIAGVRVIANTMEYRGQLERGG